MFYNRTQDLAQLESLYQQKDAQLIVMLGRRRLGKTELCRQFMINKRSLYLFVNDGELKVVLESFETEVQRQLGLSYSFPSSVSFFEFLKESAQQPLLVVLDEFQRFGQNSPSFVTELQNQWDKELKNSKIFLLLVGSSIGMMHRIALNPRGALFKRKTGQLTISPFYYKDFRLAFKNYTEGERFSFYCVFGGTPDYFLRVKSNNLSQEIRSLILQKGAPLRDQPVELLSSESRRSARYNSILEAIGKGKVSIKEVSDATGIKATSLVPYLNELSSLLGIIRLDDPLFGKKKRNRYNFNDPFFAFWYRFVYPNLSALSIENYSVVEEKISQDLPSFEGHVFEQVCKDLLYHHNGQTIGSISLNLTAIGAWWDRLGSAEVDIVAQNGKKLLLGEAKWTNQPMDESVIIDLVERKRKLIPFSGQVEYIFFSKSGFTKRAIKEAKMVDAELIDIKRFTKIMDEI